MAKYRKDVDDIVEAVAMVDENVYKADRAFRKELERKEIALKNIMGKYYEKRLKEDNVFKEHMTDASDIFGL